MSIKQIAIELRNVSIKYADSEVVSKVSCKIMKGSFVGLVGPNGAGKSTIIKAILGLVPVASGKILLFDQPHDKLGNKRLLGYLPQKISGTNPLFPATVAEIVLLGLVASKSFPKLITKNDRLKVAALLNELKIKHLQSRIFSELSGGQQQKVILARTLIADPEILIFDEPSTALDPNSREAFFQIIRKLNQEKGKTIILTTHDTGYIGEVADQLMYLDRKLIYYGSFQEFCRSAEMGKRFGEYDQHLICHQHLDHEYN
ncbi:MAG: metal ABC transporter ATP-binding protein [bacterium]